MQQGQSDKDRFRSFAERYVIERASTFNPAEPRKDAWQAVQDALSIYYNIEQVAADKFSPVREGAMTQQAGAANPNPFPPGHSLSAMDIKAMQEALLTNKGPIPRRLLRIKLPEVGPGIDSKSWTGR